MSSFQKRRSTPLLPGGKQSLHTGQQLVSTGNPALDYVLGKRPRVYEISLNQNVLIRKHDCFCFTGGGLPIGSIMLIEEDKIGRYAKYLTKLFLAEGTVHKHALFLANFDHDPNDTVTYQPLERLCFVTYVF